MVRYDTVEKRRKSKANAVCMYTMRMLATPFSCKEWMPSVKKSHETVGKVQIQENTCVEPKKCVKMIIYLCKHNTYDCPLVTAYFCIININSLCWRGQCSQISQQKREKKEARSIFQLNEVNFCFQNWIIFDWIIFLCRRCRYLIVLIYSTTVFLRSSKFQSEAQNFTHNLYQICTYFKSLSWSELSIGKFLENFHTNVHASMFLKYCSYKKKRV